MSFVRGGVTAVHGVTVQTGASLGYLRYRWVTAQNWTSDRRLSAEHGAALYGLTQGRLPAEDRAPLRHLTQRGLSAEDRAAQGSLRQMTTKSGTATETFHTHIKAVSWRCLLAHDRTLLHSTQALLEEGVVGGAEDVGPVLRMGTSMAQRCLGRIWGGRARV